MIVVVVDLRATDESMDSIIVIHFIFIHIVMSKKIFLSLSLSLSLSLFFSQDEKNARIREILEVEERTDEDRRPPG